MTQTATAPREARRHRDPADTNYDVVVVGGRCAGASLAIRLARGGWRVALVDRNGFPSDTVSTHLMFPDALQQLDELGALERLQSSHRLSPVRFSWRVLGQEVSGTFTAVGSFDHCLSIRRVTLDAALIDTAAEVGVQLHLRRRITGVLGSGTAADPVRGVQLDDGSQLTANWVAAADGQRSTVARRLGLSADEERRGEMAFLLAYWQGMPPSDWCRIDMHRESGVMSVPVEDGLHLISVAGHRQLTRGTPEDLQARYSAAVRTFPAVLNPRLLDSAVQVTPVTAVPETMLRGYSRAASGPGWFTLGDAGHLKHPSTAQGIGDALAHSRYLAENLLAGHDLAAYAEWRENRSTDHAEWSFRAAHFPRPDAEGVYAGIAEDRQARQQFLDTFTKRNRIADVLTPQRLSRWRAAAAYQDGTRRVDALLAALDADRLTHLVPACPAWSVRDLLAHLVGVAADSVAGSFYPGAIDAWQDTSLASERERWTADHVAARRLDTVDILLRELDQHARDLVRGLRTGVGPAAQGPEWLVMAPVGDLAVHLDDLREALAAPVAPGGLITRAGFALYREWLAARIASRHLQGLQLDDGNQQWTVGPGDPVGTLRGDRHELFRVIAGRRSADQILAMDWSGDPMAYLPVIAPYPLPS